ncbi:peptidoglycan D,D-transpeptidase FtsI family protein [Jiella sp. M17.18]|uniref:peptidoglycan D,D-transpeptidase FtsI family protein n=1 Tax=Jiella sp. M17.18 TaxID=3234247 RepID=UPI0034DEDA62
MRLTPFNVHACERGKRYAAVQVPRNRSRFILTAFCFTAIYCTIGARLIQFAVARPAEEAIAVVPLPASRPDILDRNGRVLATDLRTFSLYAEPRKIVDVDEAVERLTAFLPDLDPAQLYRSLSTKAGFVWIRRKLTPRQKQELYDSGIPALGFRPEIKRFYPGGRTAAHVLGFTDVDNRGLSGIERWIDRQGLLALRKAGLADADALEPTRLALDLRVQYALRDELAKARKTFASTAAEGLVLNIKTGEVLALVSLPDFDPNDPVEAGKPDRLNRISGGTAEMGSTIKTFTTAMTLQMDGANLQTKFDTTQPVMVGRRRVRDEGHLEDRPMTVQEIFVRSSNIGSAREALDVGVEKHEAFLRQMGLLSSLDVELPEVARPQVPSRWSRATTVTAAFGHGFATTPLQTAVGIAGILNGGKLVQPTFLKREPSEGAPPSREIVSQATSRSMRQLYRLNVTSGTGRMADVAGYRVGGKTGTAEKVIDGRYARHHNFNVFSAAFPMDDPRYLVMTIIDDPQAGVPTYLRTASYTAAPVAGNVIKRIAPMLGVMPKFEMTATAD